VNENPAFLQLCRSKSLLLLQGPVGPFFDRLARWLKMADVRVARVAFQGGDLFDTRSAECISYTGSPEEWPSYARAEMVGRQVDCLVLFGQARRYHVEAIFEARKLGIAIVVFEEGYFRPGFVTMELEGVNGYSRTLDIFEFVAARAAAPLVPDDTPHHFGKMALHAIRHYLALSHRRGQFPGYLHHRDDRISFYVKYWVHSFFLKLRHQTWDLHRQRQLIGYKSRYFLVPLQNDGDSQITHHSRYARNTEFIIEVMKSFAWHASKNALLVFRVHPYARGGGGHRRLIKGLAADLGMSDRVMQLFHGDTPLLAEHSQGVVLINSTVGLQALERRAPVMCLGEATYRSRGLTHRGTLDDFWAGSTRPPESEVDEFLFQLKALTQMPASVYASRGEELKWERSAAMDEFG
jgi:capsular polysaccharide export protein